MNRRGQASPLSGGGVVPESVANFFMVVLVIFVVVLLGGFAWLTTVAIQALTSPAVVGILVIGFALMWHRGKLW